tara:strand:+ start:955 stop:1074 length:120 start_codon:yes stop_codon:yes gene_type:complete
MMSLKEKQNDTFQNNKKTEEERDNRDRLNTMTLGQIEET